MFELTVREVEVNGVTYNVPTHVSRAESKRCRGWQVRIKAKAINKFFSDINYRNDPGESLFAAIVFADKKRVMPRSWMSDKGSIKQVILEVDGLPHYYIEARSPKAGVAPKRFYVGTLSTMTEERERKAFNAALKARKAIMKAHLEEQKARYEQSARNLKQYYLL